MLRHGLIPLLLAVLLVVTVACTNKKVQNPLANVGSKQPDKVLFDRAMDALKHNHYDVARITLQTLINTYPDSEYLARAKLAVGDSWYAEGGTAAMTQAEIEYKDFITFFPNMPEAAEAQLKIANIHYAEMEKPDRDFTHAERAEEEYRQLILQFPDSKLVPEAKERLREVQEVLAEREFRIGRFYYLQQSYPAAIARLRSLVDRYPLYSKADEALYMLGDCYESEVANIRRQPMPEVFKGKLVKEFEDDAVNAYSQILTRYPVMSRADDAKRRLEALHRPVPQPTKEAIAQNKAEEDSRKELGRIGRIRESFRRNPDVSAAARVGEPSLVDPKPVSATDIYQEANSSLRTAAQSAAEGHTVAGEIVKSGTPGPNQPVPRSDTDTNSGTANGAGAPSAAVGENSAGAASDSSSPASTGIGELKPTPDAGASGQPASAGASDGQATAASEAPSESAQPAPAPAQVNEADTSSATATSNQRTTSASSGQSAQNSNESSSKKKKKKGLGRLNPF